MTWQEAYPISPVRLPSGDSLPALPDGLTQKQFAQKYGITKNLRRQYLDARSHIAGYRNYYEWTKRRKKEGTRKTPKKRFKYNGQPNVFVFYNITPKTKEIHFNESVFREHNKNIEALIEGAPDHLTGYIVALVLDGKYGNNCDTPIDEWSWITPMGYQSMYDFKYNRFWREEYYRIPNATFLENVLLNPDFGIIECPGNKNLHMGPHKGIAEMHVLFFETSRVDRAEAEGESVFKRKRK